MAKRCMTRKGSIWSICIGAVILTICLAGFITFPFIYQKVFQKEITLTEGTLALNVWVDIPINFYLKLYFFNITNGDKFLKNEEPLNVTEVGPYVYKAIWTKFDHFWNSNGTISFREVKTYPFLRDISVGSQDDNITTFNGPMIIAAHMAKDFNVFLRPFLSAAMKVLGENIITVKRVRELAFEGYADPIIKYAPIVKKDIPFKDGKFGWLLGKNATDEGLFTVYTGETNSSLTNKITLLNGKDKLSFWKNDSCNNLKESTNIEMGPPLPDVPGKYTFYQSLLCRPFSLNYTEDITHMGIPTKRFKATYDLLANSTENPENFCYEINKEQPSGILDVSNCQFGAPIWLSYPHFYMADSSFLKNIWGLNPNGEDHHTHLDVDPVTGFTMDISAKYQMNIELEHVKGIFQFDRVPEGIYPVFWIDIVADVPESWANYYKGQLRNPKIIFYCLGGFFALVSIVLIISGIVLLHLHQKDEQNDPLIDVNENKRDDKNQKSLLAQSNHGFVSDYGGTTDTIHTNNSDNNVTIQTHS